MPSMIDTHTHFKHHAIAHDGRTKKMPNHACAFFDPDPKPTGGNTIRSTCALRPEDGATWWSSRNQQKRFLEVQALANRKPSFKA